MASEQPLPPSALNVSSGSMNLQHASSHSSLQGGGGSVNMQPGIGFEPMESKPGHGSRSSLNMQPPIGFQQMQPPPDSGVSLQPLPPSSKSTAITMQPGRVHMNKQDQEELEHNHRVACAACQSCFICLCCCWCVGIASLVISIMACSTSNREKAKRYLFIVDVVNLVGLILGLLLVAASIVSMAATNA